MIPSFRYIPVLNNRLFADVRMTSIDGLPTIHGDTLSDSGTLYLSIQNVGGNVQLTLYSDAARTQPVLQGTATGISGVVYLTGAAQR